MALKNGLLRWRVVAAVCAALWLLALPTGWSALRVVAGSALALTLPGLATLRLLGLHRRSTLWTLAAAGTLSPPLLAGGLLLVGHHSSHLDLLGVGLLLGCAVVLAWPERRAREGSEPPHVPAYAKWMLDDGNLLLLAVIFAGVVILGDMNPWVRQWSDGWFHAAVFHDLARSGVPPDFPHFAGQILPYPWFVHVFLVGLRWWVSPDPFVLLAALNVWAAVLIPLTVVTLGRALGAGAGARGALIAAMLGVNALGPLILLGKSVIGHTTGLAFLQSAWSDTNAVQIDVSYGFPFFQSNLLARLWTPTAFNLALALAALAMALLAEVWVRPRPRNVTLLGLVLCLTLLWHTLTAYVLAIAVATSVLTAMVSGWKADRIGVLIRAGTLAFAGALAYLAARPFLAMVTLGSGGEQLMHWSFSLSNAWGLALSMGPVALAGLLGLARIDGERRALAIGLTAGLLIPYLFFDLPGTAEEKLYFPLFVLLAGLSGPVLARAWAWAPARALCVALLLSGLAAAALATWAFTHDHRPLRTLFTADAPPGVSFLTADEAGGLRWVRERSPRDAVFLQYPRPFSNEPILVWGERRLFLGPAEFFYRAIFFPTPGQPPAPAPVWAELQRRDALQAALFSERPLTPDTLDLLRRYPWPLYVWQDTSLAHGRLSPTVAESDTLTRAAFASPSVRVLELFPSLHRR